MSILLTGTGILGQAVLEVMGSSYNFTTISRGNFDFKGHEILDITDKEKLEVLFNKNNFDAVVHTAAAYKNIDDCEKNKEDAFRINASGTKNIADLCIKKKIKLIHISTAFVFDGRKSTPYNEEDSPNPINYYGHTKLEAEKSAGSVDGSVVLRVDYTYSPYGKNFVKWIIEELSNSKPVNIVNDEMITPTYAINAAKNIEKSIKLNLKGTFHIGSLDAMSKYEFALKVVDFFDLNKKLIMPISRDIFWKGKAARPKNSFMDCSKAVMAGLEIKKTDDYLHDLRRRLK